MVLSDIKIVLGNDWNVREERIIVFLWSARRSNSSLEDEEIKCKEGEGLCEGGMILERVSYERGQSVQERGGMETFGKSRLWAQGF